MVVGWMLFTGCNAATGPWELDTVVQGASESDPDDFFEVDDYRLSFMIGADGTLDDGEFVQSAGDRTRSARFEGEAEFDEDDRGHVELDYHYTTVIEDGLDVTAEYANSGGRFDCERFRDELECVVPGDMYDIRWIFGR